MTFYGENTKSIMPSKTIITALNTTIITALNTTIITALEKALEKVIIMYL